MPPLIILAVKHGALSGLRRALAAVGQMALTNYLLHSIVASVLFLGWGFGLAGQFDYAEQLAVVVGDLGGPACSEPGMARALSLRTGRVAVAVPDLLAATTDAAFIPTEWCRHWLMQDVHTLSRIWASASGPPRAPPAPLCRCAVTIRYPWPPLHGCARRRRVARGTRRSSRNSSFL